MQEVLCRDITGAIEAEVDLELQEDYDNCGWQTGHPDAPCTGVMLCVDATSGVIEEAQRSGCNLVVSHHPLLFKGLKRITGDSVVSSAVMKSIESGVGIYSLHTALDNSPEPYGVSLEMARRMGMTEISPLDPSGAGAIGVLQNCGSADMFAELLKHVFGSPVVRFSDPAKASNLKWHENLRVAICGGSGAFLASKAVKAGADVFLTSDIKYHDFVDFAPYILLADIGHYEAERCTTDIILDIIRKKFPNFAIRISSTETNPITYI